MVFANFQFRGILTTAKGGFLIMPVWVHEKCSSREKPNPEMHAIAISGMKEKFPFECTIEENNRTSLFVPFVLANSTGASALSCLQFNWAREN